MATDKKVGEGHAFPRAGEARVHAPVAEALSHPLVAIIGPTASGKSALALQVARYFNGEIINCDSVQVYRGLNIGSGKTSDQERASVPHHLLDILTLDQSMNAGDYRRLACEALEEIRGRGRLPVFAGGTGLYLSSLLDGLFDGPPRVARLRERLKAIATRRGQTFLHSMLVRLDAAAGSRIHPNDVHKVIRALEVCILAGAPISELQAKGTEGLTGYQVLKIGLNPARDELYRRINRRVEFMFSAGLVDEVRSLLAAGKYNRAGAPGPLGALGYAQALRVLNGQMNLPEAVRDTQTKTRRYAKRQVTWFRRDAGITWFEGFGDDRDLQSRTLGWLLSKMSTQAERIRK